MQVIPSGKNGAILLSKEAVLVVHFDSWVTLIIWRFQLYLFCVDSWVQDFERCVTASFQGSRDKGACVCVGGGGGGGGG